MCIRFPNVLIGCLLAALLVACDDIAGLGPIKDGKGSLEGHEVSSLVIHLQGDSDLVKSFGSAQLRSAMEIVVGHLGELQIEDYRIERRDNGSLLLKVRKLDEQGAKKIIEALTAVTRLGLHKVSERNDEFANGKTLAQRVLDGEEIVVGQKAYIHPYVDEDGNEHSLPILLYRRAAITTGDIANAVPSPQQPDAVMITLSEGGTEKMIALTQDMRPGIDRIAIVLNDEVVSAPVVNQVPLGKHFIIEGLDEAGEVDQLAADLMHPTGKPFRVELID